MGGAGRAGWKQKGMARSVVREVAGSGSALPNTHLSHEDLDDTEETALLGGGGYENQSYGITETYHDDEREDRHEGIQADDELSTVEGGRIVVPRYGVQGNGRKGKEEGKTRFGIENQSLREPAPKETGDVSNVKVPKGLQQAREGAR